MLKRRSGLFQGQLLAVLVVGALITAIVPGISPGASAAGKPHLPVGGKNDT